jgi:hypothetical protein
MATGLDSAELRVAFDSDALQLLKISRGSLTGDFRYLVESRGEGAVAVQLAGLNAVTGGAGSLLELEFRVKASATPGDRPLDLQWARLNDGRLTLNPAPKVGLDPSDGVLRIAPELRTGPTQAGVLPPDPPAGPRPNALPSIDFNLPYTAPAVAMGREDIRPGWHTEFVTKLGQGDGEHNPNARIRVTLPVSARTTGHKGVTR